jgi:hypothetical protein
VIGDRILRYLKPVPPRHLSRVNLFLSFLNYKVDDARLRASHITPNGYGSRLLIDIIKMADIEYLIQDRKDDKILGPYLLSILKDIEKPIDPRIGKTTTRNLFIQSRKPCFELMTPSRRKNPLSDIPLGQPYTDPRWRKIKPFRVVDMGPCDLVFKVDTDCLSYRHNGPSNVIYALDCYALVAQFVAYYRSLKSPVDIDQVILDFIHYEVIVPTLLTDSVSLWMRNIYRQQLITNSRLESHTSSISDYVNTDSLGSDFSGAMVDVQHLQNDLISESISGLAALSSLSISPSGESFTEYYRELFETTTLPDQQPYVWVDVLKNLNWWEIVLLVSSFSPSYPDIVSFQRDFTRDIRFWIMLKPWQEIPSSIPYKSLIRGRLEGMYNYLNDL